MNYGSTSYYAERSMWWEASEGKAHGRVFETIDVLEDAIRERARRNNDNMRFYAGRNVRGMLHIRRTPFTLMDSDRLQLNVVQAVVDTLVAKLVKNPLRTTVLTHGGDFQSQQTARKLEAFLDGLSYESSLQHHETRAILHGCVLGMGVLKIFECEDRVRVEQCSVDEVIVDELEAYDAQPRQMFQRRYISREVLMGMYPEKASVIKNAQRSDIGSDRSRYIADMIEVIEAWHLPSAEGAGDGRHTIVIEETDLLDEEWPNDWFPLVFFKYGEPLVGFYSTGVTDIIRGIQVEINAVLQRMQAQQRLATPTVLIPRGANINMAHLTNRIWNTIEYTGQIPPQWVAPQAVSPDLVRHLDSLIARAFEMAGVSALSATSQKPAGLNSGAALREYNDIETERFVHLGHERERFHRDATRTMLAVARSIMERTGGNYAVVTARDKYLENIDFNGVGIGDDGYEIRCHSTSFLPETPAGKLAAIREMFDAGLLTNREEGLALLDHPDLEKTINLARAAIDDIDRVIELMLNEGIYLAPEPMQSLETGIERCRSAYLRARIDNASEERLDLLRRWMAEAQRILDTAAQPAPAQPAQAPQGALPAPPLQ